MSKAPLLPTLTLLEYDRTTGRQREILDTAQKQVGFLPNMYRGMANAPAVLDTYLHGYALFRSESGLTPAEQEVVFLAVSKSNGCDYCTAAHSMIADKVSGVPAEVLDAIRTGKVVPDAKLGALYDLTTEMVKTNGRPASSEIQKFVSAGFSETQLLYVVLAISVKTLSNYSNHAFSTPLDGRFASYAVD